MNEDEKRARNLLMWAFIVTMVALIVLVLDFRLKNEILEAAGGQRQGAGDPGSDRQPDDDLVPVPGTRTPATADANGTAGTGGGPVGGSADESGSDAV